MSFKCYLCGSSGHKVIAKKENIRFGCFGSNKMILECSNCGLTQLWPQWSGRELDELYSKYWKKEDFKGQKRKVKISRYLTDFIRKNDSILEIGCGYADNLNYLRNRGFAVTGIDKDPAVCNGITVFNCDVRDYVPVNKPDIIYAMHLLEHIPDPVEFIAWLDKQLKTGGRFILEIPCIDDPLLSLYNIEEFRKFYWYPYHLFFYNAKTILKMFEKRPNMKIKIILRQEYGIVNHLRWLLFRRPGNINFHVPLMDNIYKFILTKVLKYGDTMVVVGRKI